MCQHMPVTNAELLRQVHLSGEAPCAAFQPHPLKANICVGCSKLVNKHSAGSIPDDDCLLRVNPITNYTCYNEMRVWVCTTVQPLESTLWVDALYMGSPSLAARACVWLFSVLLRESQVYICAAPNVCVKNQVTSNSWVGLWVRWASADAQLLDVRFLQEFSPKTQNNDNCMETALSQS